MNKSKCSQQKCLSLFPFSTFIMLPRPPYMCFGRFCVINHHKVSQDCKVVWKFPWISKVFTNKDLKCVSCIYSQSSLQKVVFSLWPTCNSLYFGLEKASLYCLQSVQNAAARLFTGTKQKEHITSVWASLHWIPVPEQNQHQLKLD